MASYNHQSASYTSHLEIWTALPLQTAPGLSDWKLSDTGPYIVTHKLSVGRYRSYRSAAKTKSNSLLLICSGVIFRLPTPVTCPR